MHLLHGPSTFDESLAQIIEQLGMRGCVAHKSEIIWSAYQAFAEVALPDSIHHHARRQRIGRIGQPLGHLHTTAALRRKLFMTRADDFREAPVYRLTRTRIAAAEED